MQPGEGVMRNFGGGILVSFLFALATLPVRFLRNPSCITKRPLVLTLIEAQDEHLDGNRRELRAVDLFEISVVAAFPAYEGTVINARSKATNHPALAHAVRKLQILELLT